MGIYTRTGDKGVTALYGGKRISKADALVEAYGSVDELSAWLGLVLSEGLEDTDAMWTTDVQKNLYSCMCVLSGSEVELGVVEKHIGATEMLIDNVDKSLPELRNFVLPNGSRTSVMFHVARTVCRRAERAAVRAQVKNEIILKYLNRLSDALFILSRKYNAVENEIIVK